MDKLIFFDMDGTLARFYEKPNYLEQMYEKGFFFGLKPYKLVEQLNNDNHLDWNNIYIISACVGTDYCRAEKVAWCQHYLPKLPLHHILLCDVGENKAEMVGDHLGDATDDIECWLVDDYSKNICEWEMYAPTFNAIKFKNGINNKSGRNYDKVVRTWNTIKLQSGFMNTIR